MLVEKPFSYMQKYLSSPVRFPFVYAFGCLCFYTTFLQSKYQTLSGHVRKNYVASELFLQIFINLSLVTRIVPSVWNQAKVVPIHKSGPTDRPVNYRPISILLVVSNFQKILHSQLTAFLEQRNLLSKYQFGYRDFISLKCWWRNLLVRQKSLRFDFQLFIHIEAVTAICSIVMHLFQFQFFSKDFSPSFLFCAVMLKFFILVICMYNNSFFALSEYKADKKKLSQYKADFYEKKKKIHQSFLLNICPLLFFSSFFRSSQI